MRTALNRHPTCLYSFAVPLTGPNQLLTSRLARSLLPTPTAVCPFDHSRIMSTTTSASSTTTNATSLSDACCVPGSATTYPSNLTFPEGKEVKIAGVDCYSVNEQSSNLVIYSSDIFGYRFPNNRQNANQIAAAGFHVVIPDMFSGNAVTPEQVKEKGMQWVQTEWIIHNPREERAAIHEQIIHALKQHKANVATTTAIGYCYGAPGVLILYDKGLIDAGVIAHPSGFTMDNVVRCNKPTLFNCAENDPAFTVEIRRHWEQTLKERRVVAKFVDYPGTNHGFAVRDDGSAEGVTARQRAIEETIAWLKLHTQPSS